MSNFDLLDRYFSNELNKSELKAFNEKLKKDPEFNQEFQEIKEIKLAVKIEARQDIKSLFTDIEDSLNQQESTNNQTAMKRMLSVAASLILLVSVSYFVMSGNDNPSPQEVFTEYYTSYENLNGQVRGAVRGDATHSESLEAQAFNAYDMGNYALAAEYFATLVETEKTAENYFYMGMSNIEIGEYNTAVENLNIVSNNFSTYRDQSMWYLSLALLGDDKEEQALSVLASLSLKQNAYQARSKEVISALGFNATLLDTNNGTTEGVETDPPGHDSPDGVILEQRQTQFGVIQDLNTGDYYDFHTEYPIKGLSDGDIVEFYILKPARGGKAKGLAFLLDKVM